MLSLTETQQQLTGIESIDYYLARDLVHWFATPNPTPQGTPENNEISFIKSTDILFYSIIAISHALRQGHTSLYLPAWANRAAWQGEDQPGFKFPSLNEWLDQLDEFALNPSQQTPLVLDGQRLYLRRYWQFEQELAQTFNERAHTTLAVDITQAAAALKQLFPNATEQTDWQAIAAANALFSPLTILAGGPGTGKTYTVARLLALLVMTGQSTLRIGMAAPTGKAAQRLAESISLAKQQLAQQLEASVLQALPSHASTLHRLLGINPQSTQLTYHTGNTLPFDVLLIDEVSMIDLPMMTRLVRALSPQCRLILLGDADQLPSIEVGSIFNDLAIRPHPGYSPDRLAKLQSLGLHGEELPTHHSGADYLNHLYLSRRFSPESGIGTLAKQVLAGDISSFKTLCNPDVRDIKHLQYTDLPARLHEWIQHHYQPLMQQNSLAKAFEQLLAFRLLSPTRLGPLGVDALNQQIERQLNPSQADFYQGRPIIINENHHALGVYNGDIGLIWPNNEGQLMAWFQQGQHYKAIATGRLPKHSSLYAMTIHKTQGSEFNEVLLILPPYSAQQLSRALIYTALTRAKNTLEIVTSETLWQQALNKTLKRQSGLKERLHGNQA